MLSKAAIYFFLIKADLDFVFQNTKIVVIVVEKLKTYDPVDM